MRKFLLVLIFSLFTLAACTIGSNNTPDAPLELDQTYTALLSSGTISVTYPSPWTRAGDFPDLGVILATTEELAHNPFDGTVSGRDVYIEIIFAPKSSVEEDSPEAILQSLIDAVENPEGTVSAIESQTINEKAVAFVILDSEDNSDGIQLVVDAGTAYAIMLAAVANGELENYQELLTSIAGTIEYAIEDSANSDAAEATAEATEASE